MVLSRLRIEDLRYLHNGPYSLEVAPSQCVCLSGPSGSGKTLLLRAIADLDAHEGEVYLDEFARSDMIAPEWRRQVALLPAESQWWFEKVGNHFFEIQDCWLQRLGFSADVMSWDVNRLSTGERHRLALLRMLSLHPKALLLDEPTANLDAENTRRVEKLLGEYRENNAAPVLWVSHDPAQTRRVADRWFHLVDGKLREQDI
jgi:ABC-type iron transport system FetAB ATPase subunit